MTTEIRITLDSRADWAGEAERRLRKGQSVALAPDETDFADWGEREILNLELGLLRLGASCPKWRERARFCGPECGEPAVARLCRLITGGVIHGA